MKEQKYYIGIDLGGTLIKGGVVDHNANIILTKTIETQSNEGNEQVLKNILKLINCLIEESINFNINTFAGIGVGVPGVIDTERGLCLCSHNLHFNKYEIAKKIQAATNLEVKIINDANASTLAEYYFGAGKGCKNFAMLTLGTGIGGGAVIDGRLLLGNSSAGAEFGHSVICYNGKKCTCGRNGCLEQYASATALCNATKDAMNLNKQSKMWEVGNLKNITAKTAFDYSCVDETANMLVNSYIHYLATGITNIANVLRPEIIALGGGIAKQGNVLIEPLQKLVDNSIFASNQTPKVKIITAKLENSAGLVGAVCPFIKNKNY